MYRSSFAIFATSFFCCCLTLLYLSQASPASAPPHCCLSLRPPVAPSLQAARGACPAAPRNLRLLVDARRTASAGFLGPLLSQIAAAVRSRCARSSASASAASMANSAGESSPFASGSSSSWCASPTEARQQTELRAPVGKVFPGAFVLEGPSGLVHSIRHKGEREVTE